MGELRREFKNCKGINSGEIKDNRNRNL